MGAMLRYQPSLKTERLKLRPFIADDADDVQRLAGAREIADSTTSIPHPYSIGAARTWIAGLPQTATIITVGQGFVTPGTMVTAIPESDVDTAVAIKSDDEAR